MGKRWTDKEDDILTTLRGNGISNSEVASIMGRSTQAIYQRAFVLKRNEPTFSEVIDIAFAKHGIEFGEHGDWYEGMDTKQVYNTLEQTLEMREERARVYLATEPKRSWFNRLFGWGK